MTSPVNNRPLPQSVNDFHANCDRDNSTVADHHTLGILKNQASPGDHVHDGKTSKKLGKGKNLAFPTTANASYSQAQMQAVIDALRQLGWGT